LELIAGMKDAVVHFDSSGLGDRVLDFQDRRYDVMPLRLHSAFGLVCYTLSPRGAKKFSERCFPLRNESIFVPGLRRHVTNFGIDVAMNQHYANLQAFACFPPLVWTENDKTNSDISPK
jgi:glycosyl transferase, family 25